MRREAGFSLLELMIVCAIVSIVAGGLTLASIANRDEASRAVEDVASRIRARRAAAIRLNSLAQATVLENYQQPPIGIDFTNANTTATLVTEGTTHTTFNTPAPGSTGSWSYVYQGDVLSLPTGWRVATSASSLAPIPTIVLGTSTTAFNFTGDGRLDNSSLPAAPNNTNPNQESPFPAIYITDGRTARAVAVHPSGLTEIWRYDEAAGLWRGFGNRQAVGP